MKKRYTVTLDAEVVRAAKKAAIDEDTNFSAMIERLLIESLNDYKDKDD